ncbi:hypothetical protein SAMN04488034_103199 [Salinimicrobium catena]|uniref:Uncharacterized protein n=1 Tax=Salinimicrobium catena TaxID=390640 RepID=A0A1H5N140_9FLAO|nr:hypothetical protein [Salinimicrobium catena]SDL32608.1 hypothetical protein SAMN04488140_103199 [Salinimicrobium catena]SEE94368.1 hypothetical protein SAMN04488034_103199 [Salinimicrobium catena]
MSILYEILIASLFSLLLSPQEELKKPDEEKVKTEQLTEQSPKDCKTEQNI